MRPFRVPLYPILPIIGLICCVALIYYFSNTAKIASLGWGLIGFAVYFVMTRMHKTKPV
jgi:APA family basic amino acid/polyamine antiporter